MRALYTSVAWKVFIAIVMSSRCAALSPCTASVVESTEVEGDILRLSDLVKSSTCPELPRAASRVRLGAVPLPGSQRVFEGADIAMRLRGLTEGVGRTVVADVPERVIVRQAGLRWSCQEIAARFSARLVPGEECGVQDRISERASLEIMRKQWDAAARNWNLVVRCGVSTDCVPFLIRLRALSGDASAPVDSAPEIWKTAAHSNGARRLGGERIDVSSVHRGQRVILIWDQDGIRLSVPCIALEEGRQGQTVQVRTLRGGSRLRAVVEGAGILRVE